jgi:hypothetical protein
MADLSWPSKRNLATTRAINCTGYAREDGLWDIEAHLVDTRPVSVTHPKYGVSKPAGFPLHEMKIRITIDNELLIHDAEAVTIHAPFDPCAVPAAIFPELKGLSFTKGWKKNLFELMGGTKGCTHLIELLGNLATLAYQTVASSDEYLAKIDSGEIRPFFIDSCHSYKESGPVVENLYPDLYRPLDLKIK